MKAKYFLILNDKMKLVNSIKKTFLKVFSCLCLCLTFSMFLCLSLLYTHSLFLFILMESEPTAMHMLDKCSITKQHFKNH